MTSNAKLKKIALIFFILALSLLMSYGQSIPGVRTAELFFQDVRIALMSDDIQPHSDIVIVEITEQTFAKLKQRSPVERHFLSQLIEGLDQAAAKAIAIDILIDQPTNDNADNRLLGTLKQSSIPVFFAFADHKVKGVTTWQHQYQQDFFNQINNPLVELVDVRLTLDSDSTVRRHRPKQSNSLESLSSALSLAANIEPLQQPFVIDFRGKQKEGSQRFNVIRAELIDMATPLIWQFQKKLFKDKLVLIGVNATSIDRYKTPFSTDLIHGEKDTAGVFVHAHILAQYLDGLTFPAPSAITLFCYTLVVVVLGFIAGYFVIDKRKQLIIIIVPSTIWFIGFILTLPNEYRIFMPVVSPTLSFFIAFLFAGGLQKRKYQTQRDYTRKVLKHYVAHSVLNELEQHPEKLALGGERRDMSFIFTDIADFTTFSESNPAELVTEILNQYLSGMSAIVHQHQGTIDKYIGDAVVAFWGAPLEDPLHPQHALACSIEMAEFSEQFFQNIQQRKINFGRTRIGVHSGLATIGNFGGDHRYDYTAIGDTVNTTARIESANKYFGSHILVSDNIMSQVDDFPHRLVGDVILKGKHQAITLYEPVGLQHQPYHDKFTQAIKLLKSDRRQAEIQLKALGSCYPEDTLINFYLQRLADNSIDQPIIFKDK